MTYVENWEEFAKAAERLYSQNPWKVSSYISPPIERVANSKSECDVI